MTNKLTLTEQEELFAKDCKLINLKYEYKFYCVMPTSTVYCSGQKYHSMSISKGKRIAQM